MSSTDQQKRAQILGEDNHNTNIDLLPGEKSAYAYADSMNKYANSNRATSKLEDQSERTRARAVLDRANQARMRETNSKSAAASKWSVMHNERQDEESIYVVNRQLLDNKRVEVAERAQRTRCRWGCFLFGASAVAGGILWAMLDNNESNHYEIPQAPLPASWKLPFDPPTTSTVTAVEDVTTPQHAAYEWLLLDVINNSSHHQPLHRLEQRFALATLYHATRGHQWTHQGGMNDKNNQNFQAWMSSKDECEWWSDVSIEEGVDGSNTICDGDGKLMRLVLTANNLVGTIPPQVGWLTALQQLDLTANSITGTLPWTLGQLTLLEKLEIRHNKLEGSLPSELGQLKTTLNWLILQGNKLTGTFPKELWQLSGLEILDLSENDKLQGSFPTDLGSMVPNLKELKTSKNSNWKGPLPDSIGQMTALKELHLHKNNLSGSLPSTLPPNLISLKAPNNKLSGELPPWVLPASLTHLDLGGNQGLEGTIPHTWPGYGNATSTLQELKLWGTKLTGTVPPSFCPVFTLEFDCSKALCGCTCNCDDYAG